MSSPVVFSSDPTGFPLVYLPEVDVEVQLLPVTVPQMEKWRESAGSDAADWFSVSKRPRDSAPARNSVPSVCDGLFATGLLPEEAEAFAVWMTQASQLGLVSPRSALTFDLPTFAEWRDLYLRLSFITLTKEVRHRLISRRLHNDSAGNEAQVNSLLERLIEETRPINLLDIAFMRSGVVEWVRQGEEWVGLGSPKPEVHPNLWNPMIDEVRPINLGERLPYFGFRLVRRFGT